MDRGGEAAEDGFSDEEMPDVEFFDLGKRSDGGDAVIGQPMARMNLKPQGMGESGHFGERGKLLVAGGVIALGDGVAIAARVQLDHLRDVGCRVSIFIAAERRQIEAAHRIGAQVIELHSGAYCDAHHEGRFDDRDRELEALRKMSTFAHDLGLEVHVGHGLTYDTVQPVAAFPEAMELNIGHFLIGEAIFRGLDPAIREMRRLMDEARP